MSISPKSLELSNDKEDNAISNIINGVDNLDLNNSKKEKIINRGTGAGGANTNKTGKKFEDDICLTKNSITGDNGWKKNLTGRGKFAFYYVKDFSDKRVYYMEQSGLKSFFNLAGKSKYAKIIVFRHPDQTFFIEPHDKKKKPILVINEAKTQTRSGSVETKLWAGPTFKKEYQKVFPDLEVRYCFSLDGEYMKKQFTSNSDKYKILKELLEEDSIPIFYQWEENCGKSFSDWVFKMEFTNKENIKIE
jgi:hypothetical protein